MHTLQKSSTCGASGAPPLTMKRTLQPHKAGQGMWDRVWMHRDVGQRHPAAHNEVHRIVCKANSHGGHVRAKLRKPAGSRQQAARSGQSWVLLLHPAHIGSGVENAHSTRAWPPPWTSRAQEGRQAQEKNATRTAQAHLPPSACLTLPNTTWSTPAPATLRQQGRGRHVFGAQLASPACGEQSSTATLKGPGQEMCQGRSAGPLAREAPGSRPIQHFARLSCTALLPLTQRAAPS